MCQHVKEEFEGLTLSFIITFNFVFFGVKPVFECVRRDTYKQRTFRSGLDSALVHYDDYFCCLSSRRMRTEEHATSGTAIHRKSVCPVFNFQLRQIYVY